MKPPFLSLTAKVVLLVASLGLSAALTSLYATWHMHRIETQYHELLAQQAKAANTVGLLRQQLGDASALVHAVLAARTTQQVLLSKEQLALMQQAFEANLSNIYPLLPGLEFELDLTLVQGRHMFAAGQRVMQSALQEFEAQALHQLANSYRPALDRLHAEVDVVRTEAQKVFEQASQDLARNTQRTIAKTTLAGWLSLLLITACAASIALRCISRPITRLTRSMQRMSLHNYDTPITDQHRSDEIGTMARTLQSFALSLQEAQKLESELAQHQRNQLVIEQLQQLTSALPGAVFQMQLSPGAPLQLRFASPQWKRLMGLQEPSDIGLADATHFLRHHDEQATALAEKHFLHSARTMEPVDFDVCMQMMDGVSRWIKTRANPHLAADGSVIFNGVWLDATKEVMQSLALEKAKRQAEQSALEKSMLQASVSHEIRTPLNAILGLTQLLLKADLPETQREQLHNVLRASQHLRGIVNEVLDFSKIDAGQLKLESTDFSLESVVLDVLGMCHEEASKKGIALNYKMAREVPDSLRGDPHRIAQILLNYVNNAIKFTTAGHIHIALRLEPDSTLHRIVLHTSVKDTGPGIPADRIAQLFEPFQQLDNSITRRFGGTGLGLSICRALAKLMGGSAGVNSTLGQGSTFWFTAVLEPARSSVPNKHVAPTGTPATLAAWQGLRILVVDDNALNRAVAQGMLHALGFQTDAAQDGAQALMQLQAVGPDYYSCVLMDVQMPHMDGISATQALRALPSFTALPVIAMTAHTGVQDMERTQAAGMNAHLSKPLLESALHAVLQQCLGAAPPPNFPGIHTQEDAAKAPATFDASAIEALAQLFAPSKLQPLVTQFCHDSLQRAHLMPQLAVQHDWQALRAEAHKLTGTAATFGLQRLGDLSSALSAALKEADADQAHALALEIAQAADVGVALLQAYCAGLKLHPPISP